MIEVNNRDRIAWEEGMTVQDVLDHMNFIYPRITVTVNGRLVQREDYATYRVPDNASVNVFHLGHGG